MRLSDAIADYILELLKEMHGTAEIQRNELANTMGCVPSQINYVLTSRFTPEKGYRVESRRGGGGYIRITQVHAGRDAFLMHVVNSIGDSADAGTVRAILQNIAHQGLIPEGAARMMSAALSDRCYRDVSPETRDKVRAAIFKNMLLASI